MSICIRTKDRFDRDYKNIRFSCNYEPIICRIMNDSKIVFPENYRWIEKQPHGEPDFINKADKTDYYDAKLLYEEDICRILSRRQYDSFIRKLHDAISVDEESISGMNISDLPIYSEMERRINSLTGDEKGILFLPYPVSTKMSSSISCFFSDVFDSCFSAIDTEREVYLITLNIVNEVVISRLDKNNPQIEFLPNVYFEEKIYVEDVEYES